MTQNANGPGANRAAADISLAGDGPQHIPAGSQGEVQTDDGIGRDDLIDAEARRQILAQLGAWDGSLLRAAVHLRPAIDALADPQYGGEVLRLLAECRHSGFTGGSRQCASCC